MPLYLIRHSELDLAAWDSCVMQARQVVPFAQSWWLAATAGRWDAIVETGAHGEYFSVLPLPVKRRMWGKIVFQPPFTQQLGLLFTAASRHLNLLDYLPLVQQHYAQFYLQLHTAQELVTAPVGFKLADRVTYQLDLAASYPVLQANYTADYRRRLRVHSQQPMPLTVSFASSLEDTLALFRQHSGQAAGLRPRHYQQLRTLYAALHKHSQALLLEVRAPETGELLAGALFVRFRTQLVYLFAGASPAGKKVGAPLLLLDYVIRQHAGNSGVVLDFEGGMIQSIARFFANFGATPVPYAALSFTSSRPWFLQWIR